jgi:CRISPR/Cas system-associated exonuclease Cas4 (RecB family)
VKSITTLVNDIYDLFKKDVVASEAQVEELGRALTDMLKRRLSAKPEPRGLSMSSLGTKCKRQLWYKINKPELAEPLSPQSKLNLLVGDVFDVLSPFLCRWSGHDVKGEQTEMELHGIKGHRDFICDGVTVDAKTANSRSIEKFKNHRLEKDDPFGYLQQITGYVAAAADDPDVTVKREGAFLVFDKERGGLCLDRYRVETEGYEQAVDEIKSMVASPEPPQRRYTPVPDGKSGNMMLPFQCAYCSHKKECWKDSNEGSGLRKFIYSTGPRWLTKIVRMPDVKEDTDW